MISKISLLYHIKVNMSIEIYKVNKLFTIKRVSVYVFVWVDVYRWMECLGRDVNRMECGS